MSLADDVAVDAPEYVPVEQALNDQSAWTYNTLARAAGLNMTVGEDTLTDINLLTIASLTSPEQCQVRQVTKKAEARSGADWEWWFSAGGGNWLSLAVQAKKLNYRTGTYDNVDRAQCEKLIQVATRYDFSPIYVFYSAPPEHRPPVELGCRCVLAETVLKYLTASFPPPIDFDFVWSEGMAWSRLADSPWSRGHAADVAVRALTTLNGGTLPAGLIARPAPRGVLDPNGALARPLGLAPRSLAFL